MKNNIKKLLLPIVVTAIIAPSIALAAWWNPLSWFNHWGRGPVSSPQATVEQKVSPMTKSVSTVTLAPAAVPTKTAPPSTRKETATMPVESVTPASQTKTVLPSVRPISTTNTSNETSVVEIKKVLEQISSCQKSEGVASCISKYPIALQDCLGIDIRGLATLPNLYDPSAAQKYTEYQKLISDGMYKFQCLTLVAQRTGDVSVCNNISDYPAPISIGSGVKTTAQNVCAIGVAGITKDSKICDLIKEDQIKTMCIKMIPQ